MLNPFLFSRRRAGIIPTSALQLLLGAGASALALGGAPFAMAQTDTARIQGTVADTTGAVIPGAIVTVTNTGTNAVSTVTSNSEGAFSVSALPIGTYRAEVKMSGFAGQVQEFTLSVSQTQALNFQRSGAAARRPSRDGR